MVNLFQPDIILLITVIFSQMELRQRPYKAKNGTHFWPESRASRLGNAEFAGVDKAGVDNSAPHCRVGLCRSGQISTMWQRWTLQKWTMRHHVAGVDNAGVDNAGVVKCPWKMCSRQVESHRLYVRSTHMWYQPTVVSFGLKTQRSVCTPRQRVFYLTRRSVEDKHNGDRFERLRYDSKRPQICLCLRKSVVQ